MSNLAGVISAPVSTTDVGTVLSSSSHDIGTLCTHDNINMWSLYKPIKLAKVTGLTEQDYLDNNFGYTIPTYSGYSAMASAVSSGATWTYNKPTGGSSSPYRLGDFRKYDHYATCPFEMEIASSSVRINATASIVLANEITWLTEWEKWSGYADDITELNCGFYIPGVGYYPLTDTDQGLSIEDLDIEKLTFLVDEDYFTVGTTYEVYFVLTTWDGANGGRTWYGSPSETLSSSWWVMPASSPVSFTALKELAIEDYLSISFTNDSATYSQTSDKITNVTFTAAVTLSSGWTTSVSSYTIGVYFYIDNVLSGSSSVSLSIGSLNSSSFTSGDTVSGTITYSTAFEKVTGDYSSISIRYEMQVLSNASSTVVGEKSGSYTIEEIDIV